MAYIFKVDTPKFKFNLAIIKKHNLSEMLFYSTLLSFASIASLGIKYLDTVFIGKYLPLSLVGIYSIASFIPNVIETPLYALEKIIMPKISHAIAINNIVEINEIYVKTVKYILMFGLLLFLGINCNIKDLLTFLPDAYHNQYSVIYIISISALFNLIAGGSASVIFNSDKYKLGVFLVIFLSLCAFIFNIILIPKFQLIGAALVTLISLSIYAILRMYVVWRYYKIHPFTIETIKIILIALIIFGGVYLLPLSGIDSDLLKIALRSIIIIILYVILLFRFNLLSDIFLVFPSIEKWKNKLFN